MKVRIYAEGTEWELGRPHHSEVPAPPSSSRPNRAFLRACRYSGSARTSLRGYFAFEFRKSAIVADRALLEFLERYLESGILSVREIPRAPIKAGSAPSGVEQEWEPIEELRPNNLPAFSMRTVAEIEEPPELETSAEVDEGPEMETECAVEESDPDTSEDSEILAEERTEPPQYAEDLDETPLSQGQE